MLPLSTVQKNGDYFQAYRIHLKCADAVTDASAGTRTDFATDFANIYNAEKTPAKVIVFKKRENERETRLRFRKRLI